MLGQDGLSVHNMRALKQCRVNEIDQRLGRLYPCWVHIKRMYPAASSVNHCHYQPPSNSASLPDYAYTLVKPVADLQCVPKSNSRLLCPYLLEILNAKSIHQCRPRWYSYFIVRVHISRVCRFSLRFIVCAGNFYTNTTVQDWTDLKRWNKQHTLLYVIDVWQSESIIYSILYTQFGCVTWSGTVIWPVKTMTWWPFVQWPLVRWLFVRDSITSSCTLQQQVCAKIQCLMSPRSLQQRTFSARRDEK